jgi:PAS domain S-box-containing protein
MNPLALIYLLPLLIQANELTTNPILEPSIIIIIALIISVILLLIKNHKQAKRIKKQHDKLSKALDAYDYHVIASNTDVHGIITYASSAFCQISGYAEHELLHAPHNIVRHPDMPKSIFKEMWDTLKQGEIWKGEVKNLKKDGGFYWVEAIITPILEEGEITGYSAIRHDITQRKFIQEQQLKLLHKDSIILHQAELSSMGELIGAIAHQLKQPLNAISLQVQDVLDAYSNNDLDEIYLKESTKLSLSQIEFMSQSIDELKDFFNPKKEQKVFSTKEAIEYIVILIQNATKDNNKINIILSLINYQYIPI